MQVLIKTHLLEFFNDKFTVYHIKVFGIIFVVSFLVGAGFRFAILVMNYFWRS